MKFDIFSPWEIRQMYNQAKDKKQQISIIADLTSASEKEVADFLGVELSCKGKLDKRRAYKLYKEGLSDIKIAEKLGVTRRAVYDWRAGRGLPRIKQSDELRMAAYRRGLSDRQAAKELGIGRSTFRNWRYKNGLKPHGKEDIKDEQMDRNRQTDQSPRIAQDYHRQISGELQPCH